MIEREIWGEISSSEYERLKKALPERYGNVRSQRRLALQCTDYARHELDTRIRITDGTAILIQKIGNWNASERQEVELALPSEPAFIAGLYSSFCTMLVGESVRHNVIRLDNCLADGNGVEVKLTCQVGPETVYSYEIEQTAESGDLMAECRELGLEPELSYKDEAYWNAFNDRVNLSVEMLSREELTALIASYL